MRQFFPDRLAHCSPGEATASRPTHRVAPRARKYVVTPRRAPVRRGTLVRREESLARFAKAHRYKVRAQAGRGDVVHTTLLGKILTLVANKLATLDPFGVGIEMEADRPGWCDALNGLRDFRLLGERTIELRRLADFTLRALPAGTASAPCRGNWPLSWAASGIAASWRARAHRVLARGRRVEGKLPCSVFMGFSGAKRTNAIRRRQACFFLADVSGFLDRASRVPVRRKALSRICLEVAEYDNAMAGWRS